MSAITLLPSEIYVEIFCRLPTPDVVSNCRAVCKNWYAGACELSLWQKIAALIDIEIDPTAQVKDIETAVRSYLLGRRIVVSTEEKLKEKFINYFSEIPEGGTKALCYRSASNQEAFGFYIKTKNSDVNEQLQRAKNMKSLQELFPSLKGLTIIGKSTADYVARNALSVSTYHNERVEMQNLKHTLELEYFNHNLPS